MEITWYGQSCFRLRGRGVSVVTDPYAPSIGLKLPRISATIVTVSHEHEDHNNVGALRGSPFVINGPGEYEVEGIFVIGVATWHDDKGGRELGRNTAYLIEFEDLTICHLGDLGHVLTQEQVEQLSGVDILMVPVGGRSTITGTRAAEVVGLLEPGIVIPMHYKVPGLEAQIETANRFLKELAVENQEHEESLTVTAGSRPSETRVVLLEPKQ